MLAPLRSRLVSCVVTDRENVLEQIEKLDTYIATRTYIVRNVFTIADISMWAAIKRTPCLLLT